MPCTSPSEIRAGQLWLTGVYVRCFDLMLEGPDALHAAICRRRALTLVTLDRRLARAASALGLKVRIPDA